MLIEITGEKEMIQTFYCHDVNYKLYQIQSIEFLLLIEMLVPG